MSLVSDYLGLITSEHNQQPDYLQFVTVFLQPLVDIQNLIDGIPALFDLDTAVGQQLDFLGQWIGLTRYINAPLDIYFSWDTTTLGWDEGVWYELFDPDTQTIALDDPHYRILLKARAVANQWMGTVSSAYDAWNTLFAPEGLQIIIQCGASQNLDYFSWDTPAAGWDEGAWYSGGVFYANGNMTITLGLIAPAGFVLDVITRALFTGGYLGLKSAGVQIDDYALQTVIGAPMFAWDCGGADTDTFPPTTLAGWDLGAWASLTPGD